MNTVKIYDKEDKKVSEKLYGLFLEDINFACDGGLNANMVNNNSFDGLYLSPFDNEATCFIRHNCSVPKHDGLRFWSVSGDVTIESKDTPFNNGSCAVINSNATLKNNGFVGSHKNTPCMAIKENHKYEFYCYINAKDYSNAKITIFVENSDGKELTDKKEFVADGGWKKYSINLTGISTEYGRLVIKVQGDGKAKIDFVSFIDCDYWNSDDAKWSQGKLRKDLVETLSALQPKFLRFPGGCITEGLVLGNEYKWKDTVGPIEERKQDYNLWAIRNKGEYTQSFQVGFYEYFLLCEDLKMLPIPVLWAGTSCQMRTNKKLPLSSKEYQDEVINSALDLIEYANGNPNENEWAMLRSKAGHPEPFNLEYIAFGNENFGDYYLDGFRKLYKILKEKYPYIKLILSTGPFYGNKNFEKCWEVAKKEMPDVIVDEHFYNTPKWYFNNDKMYDDYDRNGPSVFAGEYAASGYSGMALRHNTFHSALSEAALLTGIERNSDIVVMSSYAPLFSMIDAAQWKHNMINFTPDEVLKTANYLVQYLFMNNIGTYIPKVDYTLEKGIYSSVTENNESIFIKIVNSLINDVDVAFDIQNTGNTKADVKYITSCSKNAKNSLEFRKSPVYKIDIKNKNLEISEEQFSVKINGLTVMVIRIDK